MMRMLKLGGELNLAAEALDVDAGGELGQEDLYHHPPAEGPLLGHEHARHASAAQLPLELVGLAEGELKLLLEVAAHGCRCWEEAGI